MAETEQPFVDPHHKVPDDQWGQVVKDAKRFREEAEKESSE